MTNFSVQVLNPLGSYMRVFTVYETSEQSVTKASYSVKTQLKT